MKNTTAVILGAVIGSCAIAGSWTEITPAAGSAPTARRNSASIYDPVGHRMIVFGGRMSGAIDGNDVWAFDLATESWSELTPAAGAAPVGRFTANGVYDAPGHRMLIWSGQGGSVFLNDVWAFDLTTETWSEFTPQAPIPNIRYGTAAVFDPQARDLVTFAGFTDQGRFDDTWRFDPDGEAWTDVTSAVRPTKRCLHSASYDIVGRRMVMYGGQQSGPLDDIWAYDLATDSWSNLTPVARPAGRYFATHVHDSNRRRSMVFGGTTSTERSDEVWTFDLESGTWSEHVAAGAGPDGRDGAAGVWVVTEDRMVVFGGNTGGALENDVWSLSLAPAQGVVLPGWIRSDGSAFNWTVPTNVEFVRGDLAQVAAYGFDTSGALTHATALPHAATPAPGTGHYYLLRPHGPSGSWQTRVTAEPARDSVLP